MFLSGNFSGAVIFETQISCGEFNSLQTSVAALVKSPNKFASEIELSEMRMPYMSKKRNTFFP